MSCIINYIVIAGQKVGWLGAVLRERAMCAFSLLLPKRRNCSLTLRRRSGGWKSALELRPEAKNIYQAGGAADN
jgi:hypothetical protein